MKIFLNFIDFSNISLLIKNFNWAYASKEGNNQLFEALEWVNKIISLFEINKYRIHTITTKFI